MNSMKFMSYSLNSLVKNLTAPGLGKLKQTKKVFKDKIELLSRKGVYPYDYMVSIDKFNEIKLPPKEAFYSKLNERGISDKD